ncbi:MAG: D-alanyl-D-alanine carboxypeptidase [Fimbriimonas ginsengisoli]|uniref:serine-type D-Ala-D-Ala carboxypeptidase n=1 Tax=Fimbriimonas ginsengisoli TaxID=1005039 RepID=A0A931PTX6_FIMGI|nr:D-alanyl-D-alanine carboxypeptidase [Fimbriimonas ginsengisoli]
MANFARLAGLILLSLTSALAGADVQAASAIAIDADSGKVLFAKNADVKRFPASTTKIMTALLLIERRNPDEAIVAPADIEDTKESSLHLKAGESITAHDMLYALLLRSANDASVAVARHIAGSVDAFAQMMNERALEIGCTNTHFSNPNGLNDPTHVTSAHDLALIAREAMRYPEFREVVRSKKHELTRSINTEDRILVSKNKWLWKDASADGIKTGYTVPAGHCYVGSATRNGWRVITVVLKSPHWQQDHKALLDDAFARFESRPVAPAGMVLVQEKVQDGTLGTVDLGLPEPLRQVVRKGAGDLRTEVETPPMAAAPIRKGQRVGALKILDSDGFARKVPLVALTDVPKRSGIAASVAQVSSPSFGLIGGTLFAGALLMRSKARRLRGDGRRRFRFFF